MRRRIGLPRLRDSAGHRSRLLIVVLAVVALLTGCSSTTAVHVEHGSVEGVSADVADPAALRATINKAFFSRIPPDTLDPVIRNTLAVASVPFTPEQQATFERCMSSNVCETGRGSLTVAFPNDMINAYRNIFRGEFTAQAIASPQVKKIIYSVSPDIAGFLANVRSLIVQQVDIIVLDSIYAGAIAPAIKQAKEAGIVVVVTETPLPPDTSTLVDSQIATNFCQQFVEGGKKIAAKEQNNKTYALYTGIPGNSSAAAWQPCLESTLRDAGWTRTIEGFTQWTPQGESQAANALLASGSRPGAIVYDSAPEDFVKPYIRRHETPPLIMTDVFNQSWYPTFRQAQDAQLNPYALVAHSRVWLGRTGVTAGIMICAGQQVNQQITAPAPIVPMADVLQYEDPEIPANTPVPSLLTTAQIKLTLSAS